MQAAGKVTRPPGRDLDRRTCEEPSESTGLVASDSAGEEAVIAVEQNEVLEAKLYPVHNMVCHVELPITRRRGIACVVVVLVIMMILLGESLTEDPGPAAPLSPAGSPPRPLRGSESPCVDHATAALDETCVCDPGYVPEYFDGPANGLVCRTCGPQGTYTVVGDARTCACNDNGQAADNYEGVFCDLPPGLQVSGAASRDGTGAQTNGNVIDGRYDRHSYSPK